MKLEEKDYTIKYDSECEVYVAHYPKYRVWSQGTTYDEAVEAINDAVNSYVTVCKRKGLM